MNVRFTENGVPLTSPEKRSARINAERMTMTQPNTLAVTVSGDLGFRGTVREFSELTGLDYLEANSLTKVLVAKGAVEDTGETIRKNGKGKPSRIYQYPTQIHFDLPVAA